ncbi:MAG: hypothetical protein V1857_06660 [archaeon]
MARFRIVTELALGTLLFVLGYAVYVLAGQLVWIQIYPPPFEKRLLDITPFALWIVGGALALDAIRRYVQKQQ